MHTFSSYFTAYNDYHIKITLEFNNFYIKTTHFKQKQIIQTQTSILYPFYKNISQIRDTLKICMKFPHTFNTNFAQSIRNIPKKFI